jgi:hypothetical protein
MLLITTFVEIRVVAGRSRTRAGCPHAVSGRPTADANSHMPCHAHAALCRDLEKSLSEQHGRGMARTRHGMCESNTASLCVNQIGKTLSKPLEARHGRGMTWAWHGNGMVCAN